MPLGALKRLLSSAPSSTCTDVFQVSTEQCDYDCHSCEQYPKAFIKAGIETEDRLWGSIKGYTAHVMVATGKTDWCRDVEDIDGVLNEVGKRRGEVEGRLMISACNLSDESVILLPSFQVLRNPSGEQVMEALKQAPTTKDPLDRPVLGEQLKCDYLILLCSHKKRDARCGLSAPVLRKEFEKVMRPMGLWRDLDDEREGGVKVVYISHVGGHKYAANVLVYRKRDGQGIWLARVAPMHVKALVERTVLKGEVFDGEMVRGGFNRAEGLASW